MFARFFDSYVRMHAAEHASFQLFEVLTLPIKRVGVGTRAEA